ncbi:hypothetical protein VN12_00570 [Pirellula sp. SH-Sr6A]|nr:hypothetical protein VN12_00570 [Pirellula sp. SH-Sr6A]
MLLQTARIPCDAEFTSSYLTAESVVLSPQALTDLNVIDSIISDVSLKFPEPAFRRRIGYVVSVRFRERKPNTRSLLQIHAPCENALLVGEGGPFRVDYMDSATSTGCNGPLDA